ncbi:MAG: hypothetical protein ACH346_08725 [Chthoniobacterales bacterium]
MPRLVEASLDRKPSKFPFAAKGGPTGGVAPLRPATTPSLRASPSDEWEFWLLAVE